MIEIAVPIVFCLLGGFSIDLVARTAHDRNLRGRVEYALEATVPLQDQVKAFHAREGGWPSAADLSRAEATPYRDGGYYKLQKDGAVLIGFTVSPWLKGRTITLQPEASAQGVHWQCRADPGLPARYLPARCRPG